MAVLYGISQWVIPFLLLVIPLWAWLKQVSVYDCFVEGAAEGVKTAIHIFPYILGMLVAIGIFRSSGALDAMIDSLSPILDKLGFPAEVLPLAMIRPLSGSGALGVTAELIHTYGPDSFIGHLASMMQGSTDTTFYILAVYFGAVGVKKYRHAVWTGLTADCAGFLAAIFMCHLFFPVG